MILNKIYCNLTIYHFLQSEILWYETSPNNQVVCPNDFLRCFILLFPFIFMLVKIITILHENTIVFPQGKYFISFMKVCFPSEIKTLFGFCFSFFVVVLLVFKSTSFLMFTQNYFPDLSSGENVNGIEKQLVK